MVPGLVGESPEWLPRFEVFGVLAANAVPLVGVGALGWQPTTLILLYWVEFSVVLLAAVVRATFAGRPSELDDDPLVLGALARRSLHVTVPRTDIGIRISSVPVPLIATPLLALLWFAVSGVTVGVVGVAEPEQPEWLLGLAVLTIVVAEAGRTGFEYFYQRAYREHSAQTALQGVLFRGGALFLVGICVVVVAAPADASASSAIRDPGTVGVPLLLGIVGLKTALDRISTPTASKRTTRQPMSRSASRTTRRPIERWTTTSRRTQRASVRRCAGGCSAGFRPSSGTRMRRSWAC